jgi:hypothetical protein
MSQCADGRVEHKPLMVEGFSEIRRRLHRPDSPPDRRCPECRRDTEEWGPLWAPRTQFIGDSNLRGGGRRRRAEHLYQQLDILQPLRQQARRELLAKVGSIPSPWVPQHS